ncbi:hypothetical protein DPMN_120321 [Dreissena polymorpha]|uniref:Uncharacterized protein n=1 Tax=Dreissena polymorpha TaxID=45954 RepID=A0A9D4JQ18_DREPO|nr:hypothetical protein DPMN_120321 [Dreissena polymorpha]
MDPSLARLDFHRPCRFKHLSDTPSPLPAAVAPLALKECSPKFERGATICNYETMHSLARVKLNFFSLDNKKHRWPDLHAGLTLNKYISDFEHKVAQSEYLSNTDTGQADVSPF